MRHQHWSTRMGRTGLFLHRYGPHYRNRLQWEGHRSPENIMPYGPALVFHIFWGRYQLSIDRHRKVDRWQALFARFDRIESKVDALLAQLRPWKRDK